MTLTHWPTSTGAEIPVASRRFGAPRDGGKRKHKGVDLGRSGDLVYAAAPGRVLGVFADRPGSEASVAVQRGQSYGPRFEWGRGGLMVLLDHDDHVQTRYLHLADFFVDAGESVEGGEPIGIVGRTGISAPEVRGHLHFEALAHGVHVDPLPLLTGARGTDYAKGLWLIVSATLAAVAVAITVWGSA